MCCRMCAMACVSANDLPVQSALLNRQILRRDTCHGTQQRFARALKTVTAVNRSQPVLIQTVRLRSVFSSLNANLTGTVC